MTATKPRTSSKAEVHRTLHLTSPFLQGPDVKALQQADNALVDHYEFDWRRTLVDGDFGRRTVREAHLAAWLIGLDSKTLAKIRRGHISEHAQHLLRNPQDRSRGDRHREDERKDERQKIRAKHKREHEGMSAAVKFMVDHVGVNENPPNSNHGPYPIDACQAYFGLSGQPWCGCIAGYAIEKIGGIDLDVWWPYAGSIREAAVAGRAGLHDINPALADVGCVVTFFSGGDDHVGLIRAKSKDGMVFTVEGNTSSATRDSDGGIIETKTRSFGEVTCVARVGG